VPVVFRHEGYRFFFFSNEGDPREPIHIHARKAERVAKFWVEPDVTLAESHGMRSTELGMLQRVILTRRDEIVERWHEHFGD
jgi:hypothetical protein